MASMRHEAISLSRRESMRRTELSQSPVAKLKARPAVVSVDLPFRSLFAVGGEVSA